MADGFAEKLAKVSSASLTDAVNKLHAHRAHVLDLVTPTPGRVLFGPAATMLYAPLRADHKDAFSYNRMLKEAVGDAPQGKVVVMAVQGPTDGAVVGGVRVAAFEPWGIAGLVTNARLRDFDEFREFAFAAYCRGETPRAGSRDIMPVAANVPVALDGATVVPGDHVYADAGGAVVIPAADLERVVEDAVAIEQNDVERFRKAREAAQKGA